MDEERRSSMSMRKRPSTLQVVITLALLGVVSSALAQVGRRLHLEDTCPHLW
jgi:hypothetical protein